MGKSHITEYPARTATLVGYSIFRIMKGSWRRNKVAISILRYLTTQKGTNPFKAYSANQHYKGLQQLYYYGFIARRDDCSLYTTALGLRYLSSIGVACVWDGYKTN